MLFYKLKMKTQSIVLVYVFLYGYNNSVDHKISEKLFPILFTAGEVFCEFN